MGGKRTWPRKYLHFCVAGLIVWSLPGCAALQEHQEQRELHRHLQRGQDLLATGDYEGALGENQRVLARATQKPPEDEALFNMGLIYAHFGYTKRSYDEALKYFIRLLNEYPSSPLTEQTKIWIGVLQSYQKQDQSLEKMRQALDEAKQRVEKIEKARKAEAIEERERGEARELLARSQRLLAQGDFDGALAESQKIVAQATHRPPEDEALLTIGLIYAHAGNPKKDPAKSADTLKRLMKDYPKSPFAEQAKVLLSVIQENEKLIGVIEKSKQVDIEIEEKKREKKK